MANKKKKSRPKSIFEKRTFISVDYTDLEQFIKDKTGVEIEIPQLLECGNDTDHEMSVDDKVASDKYSKEEQDAADAFLFGEETKEPEDLDMHQVMDTMCRHELIDPGTYLIKVSW